MPRLQRYGGSCFRGGIKGVSLWIDVDGVLVLKLTTERISWQMRIKIPLVGKTIVAKRTMPSDSLLFVAAARHDGGKNRLGEVCFVGRFAKRNLDGKNTPTERGARSWVGLLWLR